MANWGKEVLLGGLLPPPAPAEHCNTKGERPEFISNLAFVIFYISYVLLFFKCGQLIESKWAVLPGPKIIVASGPTHPGSTHIFELPGTILSNY